MIDTDDFFSDVIDPEQVPVPGSRPRVQHKKAEPAPPKEGPRWDAFPKVYRVDGKDMELFGVNALARALGRTTSTIKHWERKGWLPKTNLRLPMQLRSGIKKHYVQGMDVRGRRLYTHAFIEGIVRLAEETGVIHPGTYMEETDFPQRARDLYYDTMPGEPA